MASAPQRPATLPVPTQRTQLRLHCRQLLAQARCLLLQPSNGGLPLRNGGISSGKALLSGRLLSSRCGQCLLVPCLVGIAGSQGGVWGSRRLVWLPGRTLRRAAGMCRNSRSQAAPVPSQLQLPPWPPQLQALPGCQPARQPPEGHGWEQVELIEVCPAANMLNAHRRPRYVAAVGQPHLCCILTETRWRQAAAGPPGPPTCLAAFSFSSRSSSASRSAMPWAACSCRQGVQRGWTPPARRYQAEHASLLLTAACWHMLHLSGAPNSALHPPTLTRASLYLSSASPARISASAALSCAALSSSSCFFWYSGARLRDSRSCGVRGGAQW